MSFSLIDCPCNLLKVLEVLGGTCVHRESTASGVTRGNMNGWGL